MSKHLPMEVRVPIEADNPAIVRNETKCIRCGQCKAVCTDFIGVHGTYALQNTGDTAVCIHCGQCANVCPPASITERYEWPAVKAAAADPGKVVIFSTSPSVRVALGEEFGLPDGSFVEGKMVALLRALGADYVLDTNFSADLTILEEASELLSRVTKGTGPLPQFTSCCPAWVKYAETYHPELLPHISTAKSPIGMQGPPIKTYFAQRMGIDPAAIVNVAVTPCTAKKFEIRRGEMNAAARYLGMDGLRDMDQVITTRELALWAREAGIDFAALPDSPYDTLMGEGSGAGVIFGNTGGVMEAALRTAYAYATGEAPPDLRPRKRRAFSPPHGHGRQAIPFCGGHDLPRRLHRRRRAAPRHPGKGRRAARGPHRRAVPAGRRHDPPPEPRKHRAPGALRNLLRQAPFRAGRKAAAYILYRQKF